MKKTAFFLALAVTTAIFLCPKTAVNSAQQAMALWYGSVAPAIFPFLVLMPLLTGPEACALYERIFSNIMDKLFKLPGSAAPAIVIGMLAGSPGGAVALANVARQTKMKKSDLRRIAPIICGVGPAYLIMGVGLGLYGYSEIGRKLALAQIISQLTLLFITRFFKNNDAEIVPKREIASSESTVRSAVTAVLSVCGYMVVFSVTAGVLAEFAGKIVGRVVLLLSDLPSGMAALALSGFPGRPLVMGMAVGFGGICIAAQNMDVLRPLGVNWTGFLTLKFAHSALTGVIFASVSKDFNPVNQIFQIKFTQPYAFSLLSALILCVPFLIYLSNKPFLNKRKSANCLSG